MIGPKSESITRQRWVAKKAARAAVAFGSVATGRLALAERLRLGPEVRVLTYHRFGDAVREPFRVAAKSFEEQVRYLAERRLALSLSEFEEFVAGDLVPKAGACLVTIDDGSLSVHRVALPILRDHGVPAVLFTVAGAVGTGYGQDGSAAEAFVDWDELAEIAAGGIAVQSHSMTHRSMARLSAKEVADEAVQSRELLEGRLGGEVSSFAYPYGTRADYDAGTASAIHRAGYRCIFTSQHGSVGAGADPLTLPRVKIEGGEGMAMFRLAVAGGLDAWSLVDRSLYALQTPG